MRSLKTVLGVIGALVPVLYCGGLLYYFLDLSGSVHDAATNGLGPTLLGLGAFGLLFSIPLIVKVVRAFAGPRLPESHKRGRSDETTRDGESEFDADAVLARYMARQSAEAATPSPPVPPSAHEAGGPATRPTFGRKIK